MNSDWKDLTRIKGNLQGARHAFELACRDIFQKKFPDQQVSGIEPNPGDDGVDVYVGDIGIEPIDVFQCKYFIEGIDDSQKSQIRDSFKTALNSSKFEMKKWILCLPIELNMEERIWFNKWKAKQICAIELVTGPMLLLDSKELKLYDSIFEHQDSIVIRKIYEIVKREMPNEKQSSTFDEFVRRAEKDCFNLLQSIIHYHIGEFPKSEIHFYSFYESAKNGNQFDACQYIKSVFAGNTSDKQKRAIYLILNDYSYEPVAHKYLKRYETLLDIAKKESMLDEVNGSMFHDIYELLKDPLFSRYRKEAYWQVYL